MSAFRLIFKELKTTEHMLSHCGKHTEKVDGFFLKRGTLVFALFSSQRDAEHSFHE
jgi:hypothetical protein